VSGGSCCGGHTETSDIKPLHVSMLVPKKALRVLLDIRRTYDLGYLVDATHAEDRAEPRT
jgi:hypothetical protein